MNTKTAIIYLLILAALGAASTTTSKFKNIDAQAISATSVTIGTTNTVGALSTKAESTLVSAFTDFNTGQFDVTGNKVVVKSGAIFTNANLVGLTSMTLTNLDVTATARIADLVVSNSLSVEVLNVSTLNYYSFAQTNYNQYSVATLPNPLNVYALFACTNVVTSRGIGDLVKWDGVEWKTSENVTPSTTILEFILNAKLAGLNSITPISRIQFTSDHFYQGNSVAGRSYNALGTGALAAGFAANDNGSYLGFNTGITAVGYGHAAGTFCPIMAAGVYIGVGGQYSFSVLPDNADIYFAIAAGATSLNTTNIPVSGAFFLYDMFNVTGIGLTTNPGSNNWVAVSIESPGVFSSTDTGLEPTIVTTVPQKLLTVLTTTAVYFYTNNVLAVTMSDGTKIPTVGLYDRRAGIFKSGGSVGTTARAMNEWTPYVHTRHSPRSW